MGLNPKEDFGYPAEYEVLPTYVGLNLPPSRRYDDKGHSFTHLRGFESFDPAWMRAGKDLFYPFTWV